MWPKHAVKFSLPLSLPSGYEYRQGRNTIRSCMNFIIFFLIFEIEANCVA